MSRKLPSDYDYKRFRVVRASGKVSTLSMAWLDYAELLRAMPFRNVRALARAVRDTVHEIDAAGGEPGTLAKAVLKRLRVRYGVHG